MRLFDYSRLYDKAWESDILNLDSYSDIYLRFSLYPSV